MEHGGVGDCVAAEGDDMGAFDCSKIKGNAALHAYSSSSSYSSDIGSCSEDEGEREEEQQGAAAGVHVGSQHG
jgi:hypothetical protein